MSQGGLTIAAKTPLPPPAPTLWRHQNFMKLWAGQTVSQFGAQITLVAFPLTAVLILHASALQMGVLEALGMAPFLLVGLPVGVLVDRGRRRPLLILADSVRLLLVGAVPALYLAHALHAMWVLDAVQFVAGGMTVLFDVAYQSYLPAVVGRDTLVEGNSRLEASRAVAQVAGPSVGGALVAALTAPVALAANAATYLVSVVSLAAIRTEEPAPPPPPLVGMHRQIGEGLALVVKNPVLGSIAGSTGTANFFSSVMAAVYVLYAVRDLHLAPAAIGLLYGLGSVGGVVAALVASRAALRLGLGRTLLAFIVLASAAELLVPLAPARPRAALGVLVAAMFFVGLGGTVYNINQVSLRQAITPGAWLGRMNASMRFLIWGTMPLGSLLGGVLGAALGLKGALWVGAVGGLAAPLWLMRPAVRHLVRLTDAPPSAAPTP